MPREQLGLRLSEVPRRAAVLGRPVAHSLSPTLHRAAYAALGLTGWTYDAVECDEAALPGLLAALDPAFVGLSCTMPLKRVALDVAVSRSRTAEAVGAANTLLRVDGGWHADNTDVDGVLGALASVGLAAAPASALVLGAGGTAQAVVAALARLGTGRVVVAVRDPARAAELRRTAEVAGVELVVGGFPTVFDTELVVSTLPGDAGGGFADRSWSGVRVLLDVVYAPWPTPLAAAASRAGVTVVGGREMLLHQAGRQVELMTGRTPAPLAAMRASLPVD